MPSTLVAVAEKADQLEACQKRACAKERRAAMALSKRVQRELELLAAEHAAIAAKVANKQITSGQASRERRKLLTKMSAVRDRLLTDDATLKLGACSASKCSKENRDLVAAMRRMDVDSCKSGSRIACDMVKMTKETKTAQEYTRTYAQVAARHATAAAR